MTRERLWIAALGALLAAIAIAAGAQGLLQTSLTVAAVTAIAVLTAVAASRVAVAIGTCLVSTAAIGLPLASAMIKALLNVPIAEAFGGGGHPYSSAFRLPIERIGELTSGLIDPLHNDKKVSRASKP